MTAPLAAATAPATGARRLLGPAPTLPLPRLETAELVALAEQAGLTGRGGAGFPTARKLASVTGRRTVVVGNAMEGEPLSSKDAVLLAHAPGLVIDGLSLLGSALRTHRTVLAVGPRVPSGLARQAARGTRVEVHQLVGGFVAGQESALVNQISGRPGVPSDPVVPVRTRGVDGRPTLVLNAETLAQLALLARYGADWFRSVGMPEDPGTFLTTISANNDAILTDPGVLEVPRGTPLRSVLLAAGTDLDRVGAVLVGGYHGAWVPADRLDVPLSRADLAHVGATPGAGVIHAIDRDSCPLAVAASIAGYLAAESAGQCGPCLNGLPRLASALRTLAVPGSGHRPLAEAERLGRLVDGRGACAHPDGSARFVASTLRVFAGHVQSHLEGGCDAGAR